MTQTQTQTQIERGPEVGAARIRSLRDEAISFEEFLEDNPSRELFEEAYRAAAPSPQEIERISGLASAGGLGVVAVVEHWCPDVVASLPFVQRLSEEGAFPLSIVVRGPETQDIANAFRKAGASRIPTYVVADESGVPRSALIERTSYAEGVIERLQVEFGGEHGIPVDGSRFIDKLDAEQRSAYVARLREVRKQWTAEEQRSIASEFASLLQEASEA